MRWLAAPLVASCVACSESSQPIQLTLGPPAPQLVTFAGAFSDSETNTPLAGVSIRWGSILGGCAMSSADGSYQLVVDAATLSRGLPIGWDTSLCPFAFLDGYEQRSACVPMINRRVSWSATLQRTITLDAGRNVRSTTLASELCFSTSTQHTLQSTFTGTDAQGRSVTASTGVLTLAAR